MLGQTDTTLHPDWKIKYILYAKIQIRAKLAIYFKIIQYFLIFYFSRHLFFIRRGSWWHIRPVTQPQQAIFPPCSIRTIPKKSLYLQTLNERILVQYDNIHKTHIKQRTYGSGQQGLHIATRRRKPTLQGGGS